MPDQQPLPGISAADHAASLASNTSQAASIEALQAQIAKMTASGKARDKADSERSKAAEASKTAKADSAAQTARDSEATATAARNSKRDLAIKHMAIRQHLPAFKNDTYAAMAMARLEGLTEVDEDFALTKESIAVIDSFKMDGLDMFKQGTGSTPGAAGVPTAGVLTEKQERTMVSAGYNDTRAQKWLKNSSIAHTMGHVANPNGEKR